MINNLYFNVIKWEIIYQNQFLDEIKMSKLMGLNWFLSVVFK